MNTQNLFENLKANAYPGRGIVVGKTLDGKKAVVAYFIMGRSVNSRNRVFTETEDGIRTEAFDPAKLSDPSLIIYHPVRLVGADLVVTNGDQTDTVMEGLRFGKPFEVSLRSREFEPDAPNYTPRISAILHFCKDFSYEMNILKSNNGDGDSCNRYNFYYEKPKAGEGRFIHTYMGDGNPLPSFEGEPEVVGIEGDIDTFGSNVWNALNEENKVSLYVNFTDIATGKAETRIYNKNN